MCWDKNHQTFFPLKNSLFIYIKHEISAVVHFNVSLQTNKQHRTDLLQIVGPLESSATCSYTQPDKTWVECASWLLFIRLWLEAYYIFLRTFHFFVVIFLTFSTIGRHGSRNTSDRCDWIRIQPNDGRFIKPAPGWDSSSMQTTVSPPRGCNCSHRKYGPGRPFENCKWHRTQQ